MRSHFGRGFLALAAVVCAEPGLAQTKITAGLVSRSAVNWPEYVAQAEGFFKDEKLDVDPIYVGGVAGVAQQTTAGSLDLGDTNFEMAVNAISGGAPLSIIGATTIKYPYSLMTSPNVKTAADLKGKSVILPVPKNDIDTFFSMWSAANGLKPGDVDRIYDGASTNRYAALVAGAVAGAAVTSPLDFTAAAAGYNKLVDFGSYVKGYGFIGVVARKDWAAKNANTVKAYLRAVARAVDWLYQPANRDRAIEVLMKETKQDRAVSEKTYAYFVDELKPFSKGVAVPDADFDNVLKAAMDNGVVKNKDANRSMFVDLSYAPK